MADDYIRRIEQGNAPTTSELNEAVKNGALTFDEIREAMIKVGEQNLADNPMTGAEVKAWREEHGCTQKRLAEHFGWSRPRYAKWENGVAKYPPAHLIQELKRLEPILKDEQRWRGEGAPKMSAETMLSTLHDLIGGRDGVSMKATASVEQDKELLFNVEHGHFQVEGSIKVEIFIDDEAVLNLGGESCSEGYWLDYTSKHNLRVHRDLVPEYILARLREHES